jgi:hypothetical protein
MQGGTVITVDGEAVTSGSDGDQGRDQAVRAIRLELKLCRAMVTLDPPLEMSILLHARIADMLRKLRRYDAIDAAARQACDLTDDEVREAAGIIRALRALPSWMEKGLQGGNSFRTIVSGYALDIADELDKRAGRNIES